MAKWDIPAFEKPVTSLTVKDEIALRVFAEMMGHAALLHKSSDEHIKQSLKNAFDIAELFLEVKKGRN